MAINPKPVHLSILHAAVCKNILKKVLCHEEKISNVYVCVWRRVNRSIQMQIPKESLS